MEFQVYYRAWPKKNLRVVEAEAEDWNGAVTSVADMLKEEREVHYKPLIAVILGGKHGV